MFLYTQICVYKINTGIQVRVLLMVHKSSLDVYLVHTVILAFRIQALQKPLTEDY